MSSDDETKRRYRVFWEKFCTERYPTILEKARYLTAGNEDHARDIAQTVVERLLRYLPQPLNVEGYVYTMAQNAWKDSLRAVNKLNQPNPEGNEPSQPSKLAPQLRDLLRSEENLKVLELTKDPKNPKVRITQKLLAQGFTFPQIADRLGEKVRQTRYRWYKYQAMLKRKGLS
jgi:DNA-directed RNA polymerase specialized sigma24 family protein